MFIELTDSITKKTCLVNINHIITVSKGGAGAVISLSDSGYKPFFASESYEQVKKLIKNEVAAERGY